MNKFNENRKTKFLDARREGASIEKAAQLADISPRTVAYELKDNPAFKTADEEAKAERVSKTREGYISDAKFQDAGEHALMHNLKANDMSAVRFALPKVARERWGDDQRETPETENERATKLTAFLATFNPQGEHNDHRRNGNADNH